MPRLYSDLIDGSSRRYYYGLSSPPGSLAPTAGLVTVVGLAPTIFEQVQVFRTPATAALTLGGLQAQSQTIAQPALAALAFAGRTATTATLKVITNDVTPDYGAPQDTLPTVQTIMLLTPARASLTIVYQQPNVTQGGNIGFISPGVGVLTLQGLAANFPFDAGMGAVNLVGLAPTLKCELVVTPDPGYLNVDGLAAITAVPFVWTDDERAATPVWIDVPAA